MTYYNTEFKILQDKNKKNNKKIDWKNYKVKSQIVSESFKRLGEYNRAARMKHCGDNLAFAVQADGGMRLFHADFCRERLCPACTWRRSLKVFAQVSKVMNVLESDFHYRYLFLTLTVRNCSSSGLPDTVSFVLDSFKRLTRMTKYKAAVMGSFRALEVTYNHEHDTFHPHIHCVLAVPEHYFSDPHIFLGLGDWIDLWRRSCGVDYDPNIDIQTFRASRCGVGKNVAEVSKYAVKTSDLIAHFDGGKLDIEKTDYLVSTFSRALKGKRLVAFGGIMRKIHSKLKLDDVESKGADLVNTCDEINVEMTEQIEVYRWSYGVAGWNYYRSEL